MNTYTILELSHGDLLATYSTLPKAMAAVEQIRREEPEAMANIGLAEFDEEGNCLRRIPLA